MLRLKLKSNKTETHFPLWLKGTLDWLNRVRKLLSKESLKCNFSLSEKWQKCMNFCVTFNCVSVLTENQCKISVAVVPLTRPLKYRDECGGWGVGPLMQSCTFETCIYFTYFWVDKANGVELAMMPLWSISPWSWDISTFLQFSNLIN